MPVVWMLPTKSYDALHDRLAGLEVPMEPRDARERVGAQADV